MNKIEENILVDKVAKLCQRCNFELNNDIINSYHSALNTEQSNTGRKVLSELLDNAKIAKKELLPLCQDTGVAVFFVEIGHKVQLNFNLENAINNGVRKGYEKGYLRKSIVVDPLTRENTKDNTPAIIHTTMVDGDSLTVHFMAKGGGAENMSKIFMLKPSDGIEGIKQAVIKTVNDAGANPCPPIIVGIGIGGTFEKAALIAKHSLLRKIGSKNINEKYNKLETDLLTEINKQGIGPMGYGGNTTALAVFIETYPCHIASMPVAINIQCHSSRHGSIRMQLSS